MHTGNKPFDVRINDVKSLLGGVMTGQTPRTIHNALRRGNMTILKQLILGNRPWSKDAQGEGALPIPVNIHCHKRGFQAVLARPPIKDQWNTIP